MEDLDQLAACIAMLKKKPLRETPPPPILLGDFIENCLQNQWVILPSGDSKKKKQIKASEAARQMREMGYREVFPQTVSDLFQMSVRILRQCLNAN